MKDDYKQISKFYNALSSVYSFGAVRRCRESVLMEIKPGASVCFLGVGLGVEALKAVELGANVTVVDTSRSMLEGFVSKLNSAARNSVKIHHEDVVEFCQREGNRFDVVVAHFFLNVFAEQKMEEVLESILGLCDVGGKLVIADFWHDVEASKIVQWLQKAYWNVALFIFRRLAKNPKHSIYIYDGLLEQRGFALTREKSFKVLGIPMYRSIVARETTT